MYVCVRVCVSVRVCVRVCVCVCARAHVCGIYINTYMFIFRRYDALNRTPALTNQPRPPHLPYREPNFETL